MSDRYSVVHTQEELDNTTQIEVETFYQIRHRFCAIKIKIDSAVSRSPLWCPSLHLELAKLLKIEKTFRLLTISTSEALAPALAVVSSYVLHVQSLDREQKNRESRIDFPKIMKVLRGMR